MKEIEATLNRKQEKALEIMLQGKNDVEVAECIGVTRQTIRNWRNNDAVFIITLEAQRKALREKHQDRIYGLVEKAIEVMSAALEDEDPKIRLQAAKTVLSTAALKDSLKRQQEPSEGDQTLKELVKAFGVISKELGYSDPNSN